MLKKLLALFGIEKEAEKIVPSTHSEPPVSYSDNDIEEEEDEDEDEDEDDDDDNYDEPDESRYVQERKGTAVLDPKTLHGLHYKVEDFDAEVEKRVQALVEDDRKDGDEPTKLDIDNYRYNIRREVYSEWNDVNTEQVLDWEQLHSFEFTGIHSGSSVSDDESNPMLEPIHGVTIQDYSVASAKISKGVDLDIIIKALGVDKAVWDEAFTLWTKRMQEDTSFAVVNMFGKYFNDDENHPKLNSAVLGAGGVSEKGQATIDRMMADRDYYLELQAEMNTAYDFGIDGAQQAFEKYGIQIADMTKMAAHYAQVDGNNMAELNRWGDELLKKMDKYKKKYAEEQGGNVSDDISF